MLPVTPSPALAMHETRLERLINTITYQIAEVIPELCPYVSRIHRSLVFWIVPLRSRRTDFSWNLFVNSGQTTLGFPVRLVAKLNFSHDRLLDFALVVETP